MKNINASAIALTLSLFAVGMSAADKNTSKTEPGLISKAVSTVTSAVSSVCTAVKDGAVATGAYIQEHKLKSAIIGAAVVAAVIAITKNRNQIKKAILNNPKTSIACALGTVGVLYAYNKGYVKLPSFSSKATSVTPAPAPTSTK